uniref:Uncharacterized protein n=1 Tax=Oryzias latipes TaxID=8090 RepID=A0A3B3HMG1_ORYLA
LLFLSVFSSSFKSQIKCKVTERLVCDRCSHNPPPLKNPPDPIGINIGGELNGRRPEDVPTFPRMMKNRDALNSPDGATLTVGVLDDTKCNAADLNAWGKFFLPTTVQMQVVGYVEGSPYPCDQLVLMTCEDKKFYGYDGDELHLVAPSLEHLCQVGVDYPASRSFYRGETRFLKCFHCRIEYLSDGEVFRRNAFILITTMVDLNNLTRQDTSMLVDEVGFNGTMIKQD